MTLKFLESICCKKEIAPQPEPRITTLGLLSRLCSMTLVVLKEEVPAAPDFSTEEVAVEVNLTRRETADTDVLFLQRADSIANRVFVAVLRCVPGLYRSRNTTPFYISETEPASPR